MKAIENITKVIKMIVWLLMGVGCVISIIGTIVSFRWLKGLNTTPVFPDNED